MKKITYSVLMASMLLCTISSSSKAAVANNKTGVTLTESKKVEQSNAYQLRIEEINKMDKSNLTFSEKRELRNEVKAMKKASNGGGVYISVGSLIIIILLLVILF